MVDRGNALPEEAGEPGTGEIGGRLRAIGTAYTALQVVPTEAAAGSNAQRFNNPFVERLVGSIRRECLDHVMTLSQNVRVGSIVVMPCTRRPVVAISVAMNGSTEAETCGSNADLAPNSIFTDGRT